MQEIKNQIMNLWAKQENLIGGNLSFVKNELSNFDEKDIKSALNSLVRKKFLTSENSKSGRQYFIFQRKYHCSEQNPNINQVYGV